MAGQRPSVSERAGVFIAAGGILSVLAVYLALNATSARNATRSLLPYQTLADTLPESDRETYNVIRREQLAAEAVRARTGAWPDVLSAEAAGYQWTRFQQGTIINYFGQPKDPSALAWIVEIQEPEPGMPPDPAPPDDEHHRLADGTMLHIYIWMHRIGGQLPAAFVRQPQTSGWVEVFAKAPDPVFYNRR